MKNLIRKILKEEQDEFEWARGLDDLNRVEKEVFRSFYDLERDYGFDGPRYYQMMVDAGIRDIDILKELGEKMYSDVEGVYDSGRESGYDSGRDDCTCDGCCDDYYDWDYVQEQKEEAREEGRDEGREESESEIQELKDEIEELKDKIEDLESQLNETVNKKNIKRI